MVPQSLRWPISMFLYLFKRRQSLLITTNHRIVSASELPPLHYSVPPSFPWPLIIILAHRSTSWRMEVWQGCAAVPSLSLRVAGFTGSCWRSDAGGRTSPLPRHCRHHLLDAQNGQMKDKLAKTQGQRIFCADLVVSLYLRGIRTSKHVHRRICTGTASRCSGNPTQTCPRTGWPPPVRQTGLETTILPRWVPTFYNVNCFEVETEFWEASLLQWNSHSNWRKVGRLEFCLPHIGWAPNRGWVSSLNT